MRSLAPGRLAPVILIVAAMLSGCQARPDIAVDPSLNADNAATIYVYRPSSQWMGALIDYRVTMDDQYIGSLKRGQYIEAYAEPGDHGITVQPHFMTIPDGKPFTVTVEAEAGESYYIRFSQHIDDIIAGPSPMMLGHVELQQVPAAAWKQRR